MKYNEETMGKAFKNAFDNLEIQPSKAVWESVQKRTLSKVASNNSSNAYKVLLYTAAAAIIIAVVAYSVFVQRNQPETNTLVEQILQEPNQPTNTQINTQNNSNDSLNQQFESNQEMTPTLVDTSFTSSQAPKNAIVKVQIERAEGPFVEVVKIEEIPDELQLLTPDIAEAGKNIDVSRDQEITNNPTQAIESKNPLDSFNISFADNPTICFGEDAQLWVEDGYQYAWNTGGIFNRETVHPAENSVYTVTVTNELGQKKVHHFKVTVDNNCTAIFLPSAFTPNFDGNNDEFKAEGIGITQFTMVVFNRYGQVVFESSSIDQGWDGSYKGQSQVADTYLYQVSYVDGMKNAQTKKGSVTLIRK